MRKYLALTLVVALAASAGGLLALSSAGATPAASAERATAIDTLNAQAGAQAVTETTPAASQLAVESESAEEAESASEAESESVGEQAGEQEPAGGGHEDAGENVNHEFEGVE